MQFIKKYYTKIAGYLKNIEFKFIKSENAIIIIPIFLILFISILYAPLLFNNKNLRFQIEQKISQFTKSNLEIKGSITTRLIPTPSLNLKDVVLQNYVIGNKNYNIHIKNVKVHLSFFSSLIGKVYIKKIVFENAIIERYDVNNILEIKSQEFLEALEKSQNNAKNQSGIDFNIFSFNDFDLKKFKISNIPKIELKNLKIISYSKIGNKSEIEKINGLFEFKKNQILGKGNLQKEGIDNNFTLDLNLEKENSVLEINSSYSNFKIYGNFVNKNYDNFRGIVEGEIFNIKQFYKSYIANSGFVFDKINPETKSIKIKSGLRKNNQEIILDNIVFNSSLLNGSGFINFDLKNEIPIIDAKFFIENVDLDAILLPKENANQNNETEKNNIKTQNFEQKSLDLTKDFRDFDLTLETKIARLKYLAQEIKNIDIYTTFSKQGEILILPLTLEAPGGAKFRVSGAIEKRNNAPKFIGKIDIEGEKFSDLLRWFKFESQNLKYENLKKYSIYCDIMLVANKTILNNFYLNLNDQDTEILGDIQINYSNKNSNIISNFEVHNLNINDYFLTSGRNIYLSVGDLLKKTLWLNEISSNNDLTLRFDKLRYKDLLFENQIMKANFGPGYLEIDKLNLTTNNFDLETSLEINISEVDPKLNLYLKSKNFNYISSNNTFSNTTEIKSLDIVDQFFALPSLENFKGSISVDFENANFDNFIAKNLKIGARLKNGILEFNEFKAKIYDGDFDFKGSIAVKFDKSISGNIELKNAKVQGILTDLINVKNIEALTNISSSISASGDSKNSFKANLNSDTKFSAANISVKKYGLSDLVKKMFNPFYFQEDLKNPLAILYNENSTTNLKQANGIFAINKGRKNYFKSDFDGLAISGVISGNFDIVENKVEGTSNIIFLTGNKQKQIPINIVSNFNGSFDNLNQNTNINQALQYISLVQSHIKKGYKEIKFAKDAPIKKEENVNSLNTQLSPEQIKMIETSFPQGIPNLGEQLKSQNQ